MADGGHVYWDPTTQTPWTSYQVGSQWHQTFFDNPTSLALKAQLANTYHIAGVGIWAMGMEGSDPAMQAALEGSAPPVKNLAPGPGETVSTTTTTTTAPAGYSYSGTWNGAKVTLSPVDPASLVGGLVPQASGQLSGFTTDDPARLCLESEPGLPVTALSGAPGVYVGDDRPAGRLRRRSVGVHRVTRGAGRRTTVIDDDHHHAAPTDVDHVDHLDHVEHLHHVAGLTPPG